MIHLSLACALEMLDPRTRSSAILAIPHENKAKQRAIPPLRYCLDKALHDKGGILHWGAKVFPSCFVLFALALAGYEERKNDDDKLLTMTEAD